MFAHSKSASLPPSLPAVSSNQLGLPPTAVAALRLEYLARRCATGGASGSSAAADRAVACKGEAFDSVAWRPLFCHSRGHGMPPLSPCMPPCIPPCSCIHPGAPSAPPRASPRSP